LDLSFKAKTAEKLQDRQTQLKLVVVVAAL
jgi:hypothetical protein